MIRRARPDDVGDVLALVRALGAGPTEGWSRWRLDGAGLAELAEFAGADPGGPGGSNRPFLIS